MGLECELVKSETDVAGTATKDSRVGLGAMGGLIFDFFDEGRGIEDVSDLGAGTTPEVALSPRLAVEGALM